MKRYYNIAIVAVTLMALLAISCNKKSDDDSTAPSYTSTTSTVLVSDFKINANSKVLINLDSVFFSIDTENKLIYNVDSLPQGTDVSKLLVTITFGSSVSSAMFSVPGVADPIRYTSSMKDSLDFSQGPVNLAVTSADGTNTCNYSIYVNVHQVNPDSVLWKTFPIAGVGVATAVTAAHTTDKVVALATTADGIKQMASATFHDAEWQVKDVVSGYNAVRDLTAVDNVLYCIGLETVDAMSGALLSSEDDGETWTDLGERWTGILGAFDSRIVGVAKGEHMAGDYTADAYYHVEYPARDTFKPSQLEDGFPISACSGMTTMTNTWSTSSYALLAGGMLPDGSLTGNTWAYDGDRWGLLTTSVSQSLPALRDVTVVPYYTATVNTVRYTAKYNEVLYAVGGRYADGSYNKLVYTSSDKGITWAKASNALQMPDDIASQLIRGDAFIGTHMLTDTQSKAPWRVAPVKPITSWDCPCIYVVGCTSAGVPVMLRGLYYRLSFRPVY